MDLDCSELGSIIQKSAKLIRVRGLRLIYTNSSEILLMGTLVSVQSVAIGAGQCMYALFLCICWAALTWITREYAFDFRWKKLLR